MAKKTVEDEVVVVGEVVAPVVVVEVPKARTISFDQWFVRQSGVKSYHKGGMRSFVSNTDMPRTAAEWDEIFKSY